MYDSLRKLALSRRSIRRYNITPVSEKLIHDILSLAIWAPSAHNRQPWRFVIIQSPEMKNQLARQMGAKLHADLEADGVPEEMIVKDTTRSYERITGAPLLICLCMSMQDMDTYPDPVRQQNEYVMAVQSVAMAGQNLLLAAHALGLGACWMCAPLFCPEIVRAALNLPSDWEPQALITLGYPAQKREKPREPLETRTLWR